MEGNSANGWTAASIKAKIEPKEAIAMTGPKYPIITAFESSPDKGRGLSRDVRVRWALEEVGQPYEVRLVSFAAMKQPAHLALHPFGQIPTYEEDGLVLFETGRNPDAYRAAPCGPAAGRCECKGAGGRLDVRGGEHGRAADP